MILFPISREAFLPFLIVSFVFGIIFGALYDVFRIRRIDTHRYYSSKAVRVFDNVLIFFEDVIFSVFVAVILILISYKLYFGIPRWYSFAAAFLGVVLWRKTAGKLVIKAADLIIGAIHRFAGTVLKKLILPPVILVKRMLKNYKTKVENNRAKAYTLKYEKNTINRI